MRAISTLVLTGLFVLVLGGGAGAEALTMDGAVDRALKVNVDYRNALLAVDRARSSLADPVNWKGIAVSATQKQTSGSTASAPGTSASAASTTTLALNLPLFDQLGASASVDQDGNTQVAVTASPLVHSDTAAQSRIAYEKAVVAAVQARTSLEASVRKAWLAQASAEAQLAVQKRQVALKETSYQDSKVQYDKGQVTLAEVRTALKAWTDARTAQTTLEKNVVKARADLAGRLQSEAVDLASLDAAGLQAAVEALGPVADTVTGTSAAVKVQALEVESALAKAEAVWLLDPGLQISASASVPASGKLTWSGSVTLTLALGDWQGSDRSLADRSLDLARQTLEAQKTAARSTEAQALLAVRAALDTVDSRQLALAQAQEILQETQLLVKAGEATALELEDAELGVTSARNDVFAAWADLYGARLDLSAARS